MIKHIQPLLPLLFLFNFISCQPPKANHEFLPDEYHFPIDKIGRGRTFVYSSLGATKDSVFCDLRLITESGTQYQLIKYYTIQSTLDSFKYSKDGHRVEDFIYASLDYRDKPPFWIKGEIKENEFIDNGTKLGKLKSKTVYSGDINVLTVTEQYEYLKDTILLWQGKKVDCVVAKMKTSYAYTRKISPLDNWRNTEFDDVVYYAKGIGRIRMIEQKNNELSGSELVEIRDAK